MANEKDSTIFDSAFVDLHRSLDEIGDQLGWTERLRDRLTVEQNAHSSAQLPLIVRGLCFEGSRPDHAAATGRDVEAYLDQIFAELTVLGVEVDAEEVARAVYGVVARHIAADEVPKFGAALPRQLRQLWEGSHRAPVS